MALFDWNNDGKNDWKDDMHEYDFCRPRPNLFEKDEKDEKDTDYKYFNIDDDNLFGDNNVSVENAGCCFLFMFAIFLIILFSYLNVW